MIKYTTSLGEIFAKYILHWDTADNARYNAIVLVQFVVSNAHCQA